MRKIFIIFLVCIGTFSCGKEEKKENQATKKQKQEVNKNISKDNNTSTPASKPVEPKKLTPEEQFELSEKERVLQETKAFEAYQNDISKRNKIEFELNEKARIEKEKAVFNEEQKKISETNKALFLKSKK